MKGLFKFWVWRLALRDARRSLRPLLLSMVSVILAVASVVAAFSFRDNLQSSIQTQSKSLLGADLSLETREPFSAAHEELFSTIGGEQSRQIGFSSMAYFARTGDSRLVQVRAIVGGFPYYGALEADPAYSAEDFYNGPNALVDENVMLQFNAQVGDPIRIGEREFRISGKLRKIPGETLAFSLISPRIYIPLAYLEQTGLLQRGSLVRYRVYFKLPAGVDVDALAAKLSLRLERLRLQADTVSRRATSIAASTANLARYLTLAVFVAVLLAGVGVASVVHVFARMKASSVAVLRCIGAGPEETVCVYVLQILLVALASSILGVALGIGIQYVLPLALKDFLRVDTVVSIAPSAILAGLIVGLGASLLFALIPLVPLRRVSPLLALRASIETERPAPDRLVWILFGLVAFGIWAFAVWTTGSRLSGTWFTVGVLAVFGVLFVLARCASLLLRNIAPRFFTFSWRQGLANLHRPNNQTAAVMLAVGLGTFLLVTLYSTQNMLVSQVSARVGPGEPNLVLFDVQRDQRAGIAELIRARGVTLREEVPIVTMRLARVKDQSVEDLRAEGKIPGWTLRREYRSTYRTELSESEEIIEGSWQGKAATNIDSIPISIEEGIAKSLRVRLGDEVEFEIQGVPLVTRVASVRKVDWQRVQPNFFVVFPAGVLESAPQFFAVVARAESAQAAADLQRSVVERFPNVSAIDLGLILNTLQSILAKISAAMRFIALFTIVIGFAVLASAVLGSRSQRLRESILLRTLGAPRAQILAVIAAEFLFLGAIAASAGAVLGLCATWALSFYFFGTPILLDLAPVVLIFALVTAATVSAGAAGCWGIFRYSPLESLRAEA